MHKQINNTQVYNDLDVVMSVSNLIEYIDNYQETSRSFCQYYRNVSGEEINTSITDSKSFTPKVKITGKPPNVIMQRMLK